MTATSYDNLDAPGNSEKYRTGKPCIEGGCNEPAGTAWSPHWCVRHNIERIDRINRQLDTIMKRLEVRDGKDSGD